MHNPTRRNSSELEENVLKKLDYFGNSTVLGVINFIGIEIVRKTLVLGKGLEFLFSVQFSCAGGTAYEVFLILIGFTILYIDWRIRI